MCIGAFLVAIAVCTGISSMLTKILVYAIMVYLGYKMYKKDGINFKIAVTAILFWIIFTVAVVFPGRVSVEDSSKPGLWLLCILLYGFAGGIGILFICSKLKLLTGWLEKLICELGKSSLYIYILHFAIIYVAEIIGANQIWQLCIVVVAAIGLPMIAKRVVENTKCECIFRPSILIGRKKL